jgi:hypothetical protein
MVEFGTGLRARLARENPMAPNGGARRRLVESPDLRPFYELMKREAFVFSQLQADGPEAQGQAGATAVLISSRTQKGTLG